MPKKEEVWNNLTDSLDTGFREDYTNLSWQKLKGEKPVAYAAFLKFLELKPQDRKATNLAAQTGISHHSINEWIKKYDWQDRAALYDAEQFHFLETEKRKILETRATEWAREASEMREASMRVSRKMIKRAEEIIDQSAKKKTGSISDVPKLVDSAVKTARLAANLSTENIGVSINILQKDPEKLETPEQLENYLKELEQEEQRLLNAKPVN